MRFRSLFNRREGFLSGIFNRKSSNSKPLYTKVLAVTGIYLLRRMLKK